MHRLLLILSLFLSGTSLSHAGDWSTSSISLLYGDGYKLDDHSQSIITLDHARSWHYGDMYIFMDAFNPFRANAREYGEFHVRFSLSKITGHSFNYGLLRDISIATQIELGTQHQTHLYGLGFDFNLPSFSYFNVNVYARDNIRRSGSTWQITPYWKLPFKTGSQPWSFEGLVVISGNEGTTRRNVIAQPQLLLDIGHLWGKPSSLWAGIELQYTHNKYGVKSVSESFPQAIVKWRF